MPASADALPNWIERLGSANVFSTLAELTTEAAVFAVDADRRIIYWSPGAEELLGFRAADVVGEHCLKAHRCQHCLVGCGLEEHRRLRGVHLELIRDDGIAAPVEKSGRAFFDADGRFAGGIEVLRPRTASASAPRNAPKAAATSFHGLVSRDAAMRQVFQVIRNVAETDATVLVRGESGSGKELVARAIHAESHRQDGVFIPVNCAALTPSLVESELFGHKRGAFTGAARDRDGLFAQADGGTLFLDEVAELSLDVQAKLLRVLEAREVLPVGASGPRKIDVRIVAATHRALRQEVKAARFREDLMYRLRVVPLFVPPLRDRPHDIEVLLAHFIALHNERGPRHVQAVAPGAMRALLHHPWPGNVRELRNVVEYAFAVGRGDMLERAELPPELRETVAPAPPRRSGQTRQERERERILEALDAHGGRLAKAAEALGISRATLWRRRKKLGID